MESQKEKEQEGNKLKNKQAGASKGKDDTMQMVEQNLIEIDKVKEDLSVKEQVMKHLL